MEKLSETFGVYSKNKFEKLVHLVGFIVRVYHDARSSECQTRKLHLIVSVFCSVTKEWKSMFVMMVVVIGVCVVLACWFADGTSFV